MKFILISLFLLFTGYALAQDSDTLKVDLKLICELNKLETSLKKDKSMTAADLAERIASMKEAGLRSSQAKESLKSISQADPKDTRRLWKQVAKENHIQGINCL